MNEQFLTETFNLFDSPEKWNVFLELANQKERLKALAYSKLKHKLLETIRKDSEIVKDWSVEDGGLNIYWKLWIPDNEGDEGIIYLELNNFNKIGLLINAKEGDIDKLNEYLKQEEYSELKILVDRVDEEIYGWWVFSESGNFHFDSPYDGKFTIDSLAWYAWNDTDRLAKQIIDKFARIVRDPKMTGLVKELCVLCKK